VAQINRLKIQNMAAEFVQQAHHAEYLNLSVHSAGFEEVIVTMPYQQHIIADKQLRKVCRSAYISLMDITAQACALCTLFYRMHRIISPYSMDMCVDYAHQASIGFPLFARAQCAHFTPELLLIRVIAYQHFIEVPLAYAWASFPCTSKEPIPEQVQALLLGEQS
tara:strand:- start:3614 stop:4108 length:495 start_codon:yes stop_codon:yes gene_type:complete